MSRRPQWSSSEAKGVGPCRAPTAPITVLQYPFSMSPVSPTKRLLYPWLYPVFPPAHSATPASLCSSRPLQFLSHELSALWHFLCLNLCCYHLQVPKCWGQHTFTSLVTGQLWCWLPCAKGLPLTQNSMTWGECHMTPSIVSLGLPPHWVWGKAGPL